MTTAFTAVLWVVAVGFGIAILAQLGVIFTVLWLARRPRGPHA